MINAIVFPYHNMATEIFKNDYVSEINIVGYLTFSCLISEESKLISLLPIYFNYKSIPNDVDAIIWVDYFSIIRYGGSGVESCKKDIFSIVECFIEMKKKIICCEELSEFEIQRFKSKAKSNMTQFIYLNNNLDVTNMINVHNTDVVEFKTPTILISGVTENCGKFHVQLQIRKLIQDKGLKVSQIGSKHYSELFGIHPFPDFMYSDSIGELKKISILKRYLEQVINKEMPDVLIIGVPHGILNTSERIIDNYGLLHYMVSCAIGPATLMMSVPFFDYTNRFFEELNQLVCYRYGQKVCVYIGSNIMKDERDDDYYSTNTYCIVPKYIVENKINKLNVNNLISSVVNSYDYLWSILKIGLKI